MEYLKTISKEVGGVVFVDLIELDNMYIDVHSAQYMDGVVLMASSQDYHKVTQSSFAQFFFFMSYECACIVIIFTCVVEARILEPIYFTLHSLIYSRETKRRTSESQTGRTLTQKFMI